MWQTGPQQIRPMALGFNPNAHKYKTCCGCCHYKLATQINTSLEGGLILFYLVGSIIAVIIDEHKILAVIQLVVTISIALTIALAIVGWLKEQCNLLVPYIINKILSALLLVVLMVFVFLAGEKDVQNAIYADDSAYDAGRSVKGGVMFVLSLLSCANMLAFSAAYGCYRYFRDKQLFIKNAPPPQQVYRSHMIQPQAPMHMMSYGPSVMIGQAHVQMAPPMYDQQPAYPSNQMGYPPMQPGRPPTQSGYPPHQPAMQMDYPSTQPSYPSPQLEPPPAYENNSVQQQPQQQQQQQQQLPAAPSISDDTDKKSD